MKQEALVEYKPSANEVIIVEQLPVIREQLELMRDGIENDVATALALECTEDTVKTIKDVRARLKKDFDILERKRIEAKRHILQPYEHFEKIYRECITDIYGPADDQLRKKIADVEDGLKDAKKEEILAYFGEYCTSKGIDFLTFEQAGIVVTLTASRKGLKTQAATFIDRVADDIAFIETNENAAEVLVEYKKSLNAVQAVTIVRNRHKALEEEQMRLQTAQLQREAQANVINLVDKAVQAEMQAPPPLQAPAPVVAAPSSSETPQSVTTAVQTEKILKTTFTVKGTKEQLLALRKFLVEGGYYFE